jgi:hypothetical protein
MTKPLRFRATGALADYLRESLGEQPSARPLELDSGAPAFFMDPSGAVEQIIPKTADEIADLIGVPVRAVPLPTTGHKASTLWVESAPAPDALYNDAATRTLRFFLTKIAGVTFEPPPVRGRAVLVVGTIDHETEN